MLVFVSSNRGFFQSGLGDGDNFLLLRRLFVFITSLSLLCDNDDLLAWWCLDDLDRAEEDDEPLDFDSLVNDDELDEDRFGDKF